MNSSYRGGKAHSAAPRRHLVPQECITAGLQSENTAAGAGAVKGVKRGEAEDTSSHRVAFTRSISNAYRNTCNLQRKSLGLHQVSLLQNKKGNPTYFSNCYTIVACSATCVTFYSISAHNWYSIHLINVFSSISSSKCIFLQTQQYVVIFMLLESLEISNL